MLEVLPYILARKASTKKPSWNSYFFGLIFYIIYHKLPSFLAEIKFNRFDFWLCPASVADLEIVPQRLLLNMGVLFALPASQEDVMQQMRNGQRKFKFSFGTQLVSAGASALLQGARKLRVGASLPAEPARVSNEEVQHRLDALRGLSRQFFVGFRFDVEPAVLQQMISETSLERSKVFREFFHGELEIQDNVDLLHIQPSEPCSI